MSLLLRRYHEAAKTTEEQAEVEPTEADAENQVPEPEAGEPAGNASKEAWHKYALSQGYTEEGLDGRTRDEIRDLFND